MENSPPPSNSNINQTTKMKIFQRGKKENNIHQMPEIERIFFIYFCKLIFQHFLHFLHGIQFILVFHLKHKYIKIVNSGSF